MNSFLCGWTKILIVLIDENDEIFPGASDQRFSRTFESNVWSQHATGPALWRSRQVRLEIRWSLWAKSL